MRGTELLFLIVLAPAYAEDAESLVRQLGAEAFDTRTEAQTELRRLGESARQALKLGADGEDLEVTARCKTLLARLDLVRSSRLLVLNRRRDRVQLMIVRLDGTDRIALKSTLHPEERLLPIQGGRFLVWGRSGVRLLDIWGDADSRLTDVEAARAPHVSASGEKALVVTSGPRDRLIEIALQADQREVELFDPAVDDLRLHEAQWAGDSRVLLLCSPMGGPRVQDLMDLSAGKAKPLTYGHESSWLRSEASQSRVAWLKSRNHECDVMLMEASASKPVRIHEARCDPPDAGSGGFGWSPDGRFLHLLAEHVCQVLDPGKGTAMGLADVEGGFCAGSWSPDSRWIAFIARDENGRTLRVASTVFDDRRVLGPATRFVENREERLSPWSPGSEAIAFLRDVVDENSDQVVDSTLWIAQPPEFLPEQVLDSGADEAYWIHAR